MWKNQNATVQNVCNWIIWKQQIFSMLHFGYGDCDYKLCLENFWRSLYTLYCRYQTRSIFITNNLRNIYLHVNAIKIVQTLATMFNTLIIFLFFAITIILSTIFTEEIYRAATGCYIFNSIDVLGRAIKKLLSNLTDWILHRKMIYLSIC